MEIRLFQRDDAEPLRDLLDEMSRRKRIAPHGARHAWPVPSIAVVGPMRFRTRFEIQAELEEILASRGELPT